MSVVSVKIPETINVDVQENISVDDFLKLLYTKSDDVEDYIDVKNKMKEKNNKFYNFTDIVDEY
ncbi:hypothetical protein HOG21_01295 [bacterium]|jgi:hypothetical protein|nr:hypothetical protein [bacterium]